MTFEEKEEILRRARALPSDKLRCELVNEIRLRAARSEVGETAHLPQFEIDERDRWLLAASEIEAGCSTALDDNIPRDETRHTAIGRVRSQLITALKRANKNGAPVEIDEFVDRLKTIIKPSYDARLSLSEQNVLDMLIGVRDGQPLEPAHLRKAVKSITDRVIRRRPPGDSDRIDAVKGAIGSRGGSDGGEFVPWTEFDKRPTFGADRDLDHTKPGRRQDRRNEQEQRRLDLKAGRLTKTPQQSLSRADAWLTVRRYNVQVIEKRTQESIYLRHQRKAAELARQVIQAAIAHGDIEYCKGKPPKVWLWPEGPFLHPLLRLKPDERARVLRLLTEKVKERTALRYKTAHRLRYFDETRDRIRAAQGLAPFYSACRSERDWKVIARGGDAELPPEKRPTRAQLSERDLDAIKDDDGNVTPEARAALAFEAAQTNFDDPKEVEQQIVAEEIAAAGGGG